MPWKTAVWVRAGRAGRTLQFGHGGDAVENPQGGADGADDKSFNSATAVMPWKTTPTPMRAATVQLGFNSATAVMPWKTGVALYGVGGGPKLQFGHGGDAVENRTGSGRAKT